MKRMLNLFAYGSTLAVAALVIGCAKPEEPAPKTESTESAAQAPSGESGGHSHGEGPHGGTLADWGGGKYHVEFTVSHDDKEATVYVLGSDEKTTSPIKAKDGKLLLTIAQPDIQAELVATPQEGDPEGTSSRFVGQHDNLSIVQEYAGTITGEVDGTPYSGDFKEEPHGH